MANFRKSVSFEDTHIIIPSLHINILWTGSNDSINSTEIHHKYQSANKRSNLQRGVCHHHYVLIKNN